MNVSRGGIARKVNLSPANSENLVFSFSSFFSHMSLYSIAGGRTLLGVWENGAIECGVGIERIETPQNRLIRSS